MLEKPCNLVRKGLGATVGTLARHVLTFNTVSFWEPRRNCCDLRCPLLFHFPSVSILPIFNIPIHNETVVGTQHLSRPSALHRCPPGAAWWGAHVDSSKVASKYLSSAPRQVPRLRCVSKFIRRRGMRSNTSERRNQ